MADCVDDRVEHGGGLGGEGGELRDQRGEQVGAAKLANHRDEGVRGP